RNYGVYRKSLSLAVELVCPLGDIQFQEEMKLSPFGGAPGIVPSIRWEAAAPTLRYERVFGRRTRAPTSEFARLYGDEAPRDGQEVSRALAISTAVTASPGVSHELEVDVGSRTRIELKMELPAEGRCELKLALIPERDRRQPRTKIRVKPTVLPRATRTQPFPRTQIRTGNSTLNLILAQAEVDFDSLELPLVPRDDSDSGLYVVNAGIPRYMGLFSRDILTTSWQGSLLSPRYLRNAVESLALLKGTRFDAWRDEEPGQIPHEVRLNPRAAMGETNRELYYGDVVSTAFWLVTLATTYLWEGDRQLLFRNRDTITSGCAWIRRRLGQGNGFLYYAPGTAEGNRHHAWKDSGDAIVDRQGRIAVPPLAACEVQGYCFMALLAAAGLSVAMGEAGKARELFDEAQALKRRFNQAFWMEEQSYFAVALDGAGRRVDSVTSNPGHCLGCGIISRDRIPAVVARMISDDLFSGWGIRTLSSANPAFDPFSYHRGSVWPVENATIAGGFRLCGFDEPALQLIEAQLATATLFPGMRLPELLSGHARSEAYPIPGLYKDGNTLQAWSVSGLFFSILILLGLRPVAPLGLLLVKPALPDWLPWLELRQLRVGSALVDLRFWRDSAGKSRWQVLAKQGSLRVLEQPAELDLEATLGSRIRDALRSVFKSAA
ncbi:MAG: hypothetical protein NDJ90_14750, partial [Oligoflexia bacterium]|nr:hypothetical protein [Oligoflexia bacterium]